MNKLLWYLINLRWNLIKYIQFDGFINDVMFYSYLVAVVVGITGLTCFSYFRKMMSYVFRGYYDVIVVLNTSIGTIGLPRLARDLLTLIG